MTANDIIQLLNLTPLPEEGGFYKETFRAKGLIPTASLPEHSGDRVYSTQIYYLVTPEEYSALHRVKGSDEFFHFYLGDPVEMIQIDEHGQLKQITLGQDIKEGQKLQALAPKNVWQGTRLIEGGQWALLGCTVAPGFEFEDFEVKSQLELTKLFPQHRKYIERFARP